ncbi:hypothetical protein QE152_g29115 [Popillia japonica]|uniref:Uncharacterized protein n=1 Tax=Popillia japonica TaxID=7064 RepID=A0AAW1JI20_POPJA
MHEINSGHHKAHGGSESTSCRAQNAKGKTAGMKAAEDGRPGWGRRRSDGNTVGGPHGDCMPLSPQQKAGTASAGYVVRESEKGGDGWRFQRPFPSPEKSPISPPAIAQYRCYRPCPR